jgi:hypothetical protein
LKHRLVKGGAFVIPIEFSNMPTQLTHLHAWICDHYGLEEFRTLCFRLGVKYDDVGGEMLESRARELLLWLGRRRRFYVLGEGLWVFGRKTGST